MLNRFAATYPFGLAVVRFSGSVCAANPEALALLSVDETGVVTDKVLRAAIAVLLARVVTAKPFVEAHATVRRPRHVTLHLAAVRIAVDHAGLLVRAEVARDDGGFSRLVEHFGLTAAEARLALRVHEGMSNTAIAAALNLSVGVVNTRLCRLYQRIGVRCRASLAQLVEQARATNRPLARQPARGDGRHLDHPLVPVFLSGTGVGLAIVDPDRRWIWANPIAQHLTDRLTISDLELVLAGDREQLLERLCLRAQSWPIDGALLGLKVEAARQRAADREDW